MKWIKNLSNENPEIKDNPELVENEEHFNICKGNLDIRLELGTIINLFIKTIRPYKINEGKWLVECMKCRQHCMILNIQDHTIICRHNYNGMVPVAVAGLYNIDMWYNKQREKNGYEAPLILESDQTKKLCP